MVARLMRLLIWVFLAPLVSGQTAPDDDTARQRVSAVKNPFAKTIVLPFEIDTARPMGPYSRVQDAFTFQPLIPFLLGRKWDLITQTVIPVVSQPDTANPRGRKWGLSDINSNLYFSPDTDGMVKWGAGPSFLFPTATDRAIGAGKWSAGPTGAVFIEPGQWTLGVIVSDLKSFAGDRNRPDVHYMTLQYQVTWNFCRSWYVTTSPTSAADWTAARGERWLMPVGLGVGKVFGLGKRQVSGEASASYSLIHPKTQPYPKWVLSLQLTLAHTEFK